MTTRASKAAKEWLQQQVSNGSWVAKEACGDSGSYVLSYDDAFEAGVDFAVKKLRKKRFILSDVDDYAIAEEELDDLLKEEEK
jgi:hypothetical protein